MESDFRKQVGERLMNLRSNNNLSQEMLANQADLDRSYISRIERGIISPSVENLSKICNVLNTSLSKFFHDF
ncbi:helix-turn-helix domain-containing protein [Marinoscillum pacificum]|uniref:helix-turn-helix domain-containing protein n=1 Tax=Marinoscillum pacificum TaxID=392723 RepID=UPI00358F4CA3